MGRGEGEREGYQVLTVQNSNIAKYTWKYFLFVLR